MSAVGQCWLLRVGRSGPMRSVWRLLRKLQIRNRQLLFSQVDIFSWTSFQSSGHLFSQCIESVFRLCRQAMKANRCKKLVRKNPSSLCASTLGCNIVTVAARHQYASFSYPLRELTSPCVCLCEDCKTRFVWAGHWPYATMFPSLSQSLFLCDSRDA